MKHEVYHSVEELLAPETLSKLLEISVQRCSCQPIAGGVSGSKLEAVVTDVGSCGHLVLKQMALDKDWEMMVSDDRYCRAVTLWCSGQLDKVSAFVDSAIVACARDGNGWAILMRDVSSDIIGKTPSLSAAKFHRLLTTLAGIHATFWDAPDLSSTEVGLCDTTGIIQALSVETFRRMPIAASYSAPQRWLEGWPLLQERLASDVAEILEQLLRDTRPISAALDRYPHTLVHGDFRETNIGLSSQQPFRAIVLDWQLAAYSAATIDLAWFLTTPTLWLSPISTENATELYRQLLVRRLGQGFDPSWWQPLLDLGLLVNILRKAPASTWSLLHGRYHTHPAHEAGVHAWLTGIDDQVRSALRWL